MQFVLKKDCSPSRAEIVEIIKCLIASKPLSEEEYGELSEGTKALFEAVIQTTEADEIPEYKSMPRNIELTYGRNQRKYWVNMTNKKRQFFKTTGLLFVFRSARKPKSILKAKIVSFENNILIVDPTFDHGGIKHTETDSITLSFGQAPKAEFLGYIQRD